MCVYVCACMCVCVYVCVFTHIQGIADLLNCIRACALSDTGVRAHTHTPWSVCVRVHARLQGMNHMYPPPHLTHMCACMSAGNESQLLPGGGQGCGKLPVGCTAPQVTHTCILLLMYMWQASFWMYCPPSDTHMYPPPHVYVASFLLDVLPPK